MRTVQHDSYQPYVAPDIEIHFMSPFSSDTQGLGCHGGMIQATTDSCMDSTNSNILYLCSCCYTSTRPLETKPNRNISEWKRNQSQGGHGLCPKQNVAIS